MNAPERLILEANEQADLTPTLRGAGGLVMVTPPISETYFLFRVQLDHGQSMLAFPKFGTIRIGFAKEEDDWNTNLPWACSTEEIYQHIKKNKSPSTASETRIKDAIRLLQDACAKFVGEPKASELLKRMRDR